MEYVVSIRIVFSETVSKVLKLEKDRFVAEYGSSYKSEPHITLYLDRYTQDGFPRLLQDLRVLNEKRFIISLLKPVVRREEDRRRNLYVVDVSNKQQIRDLRDKVAEIAIRYQSPLLRSKVRQHLENEGIHTDGTRKSQGNASPPEAFDPHITLGAVGSGGRQPDLADIRANLKDLEGEKVTVSELVVVFDGKADGEEKFKAIEKISIPLL